MEVRQGFSIRDISPSQDSHHENGGPVVGEGGDADGGAGGGKAVVTVCQRDVYERHNAWETFDVTYAVRYWLSHPAEAQMLQVRRHTHALRDMICFVDWMLLIPPHYVTELLESGIGCCIA